MFPRTLQLQTEYFERNNVFPPGGPFWKEHEWFFAKLKDEYVGYIGVSINVKFNEERQMKSGWIRDIGVLKPYRRRGIGTSLMLQGLATLKANGMTSAM